MRSASYQPPDLLRLRRVKKYAKGVGSFTEKIWGSTSHDDGASFVGDSRRDSFHDADHAVGIEGLRLCHRHAALIASTPENFCKSVECAIYFFRALFDGAAIHMTLGGDFLG